MNLNDIVIPIKDEMKDFKLKLKSSISSQNSLIDTVIQEVGAESMADFGKVMPEVMKRGAGQVDGGMAQTLLKSKLS